MNIQQVLEAEHNKPQILRIIAYIGDDTERFDELMNCFFADNYRLCQRASWAVGDIGEKKSHLLEPYLERLLLNINQPTHHDAIIRNTMRVFKALPTIPDDLLGLTVDTSFRYMIDPSVAVAIRMFSMRVLHNVCRQVPELKEELRLTIEDMIQYETRPGILSAGRDVLKKLSSK